MPPHDAMLNDSAPAQPPFLKWAAEKPGATTPMNTHSSTIAMMVTTSSKLAAIVMPAMLSAMKTM